jgi:hypothetical protein
MRFSIFFRDHFNKLSKIDDYIVDVEDGIFEISNHKLYSTLTFVTNGVFYRPDIVGDLVERIEVWHQTDDKVIKEKFVIDGIEYLTQNNIKIYCKSPTIRYSYKYSGNQNQIVKGYYKDIIKKLLRKSRVNLDNLTDFYFLFDFEIKNKSIEDSIEELANITKCDYYYHRGVIYFEDKKTIKEYDTPLQKFNDIEDIFEFSTTSNKDEKKINKLLINEKEEHITTEPKISLSISKDPFVVSPPRVEKYKQNNDENNKTDDSDENVEEYAFVPIQNQLLFYLTPLGGVFKCNLETELMRNYTAIGKYELNNEDYLIVTAGIKKIVAIEVNGEYLTKRDYRFETNFNYIIFNKRYTGELKISYKTDIYRAIIPPTQIPKDYKIYATYYDQELNYTLKTEYNGYYPLPYIYKLNLIKEWNMPPDIASGRTIYLKGKIYERNYKGEMEQNIINESYKADPFGEVEIEFREYGNYILTGGYEPVYISFYKNKFNITQDKEQSC